MTIKCPGCNFSNNIGRASLPKTERFIATCPKCSHRFTVNRFMSLRLASNGTGAIETLRSEPDTVSEPVTGVEIPTTANPTKKRHLKIVKKKTGLDTWKKKTATPENRVETPPESKAESDEKGHSHGSKGHGSVKVCCGECSGKCDGSGKTEDNGGTGHTGPLALLPFETEERTEAGKAEKDIVERNGSSSSSAAAASSNSSEKGSTGLEKYGAIEAETGTDSGTDSGNKDRDPLSLSFHGSGFTLFGIYLTNMLLTIATLGVYSFWGTTKVRQYLYSGCAFMDERFSYTGTGRELFMGKVRATGLIILIFGTPQALSRLVHPAFDLLILPVLLLIPPIARTLTKRYRLSRSKWRSIQFSFRGTVKAAIKLYLWGTFKSVITLGQLYPKYYIDKENFWRGNTWYGDTAFKYGGRAKDVKRTILSGSALTLLTFGIYGFWLSAKLARYNWAHTSYKGLKFNFTATGKEVLNYKVGNVLLTLFTLGLGYAWVKKRRIDFNFKHIGIEGEVDFARISQSAQKAGATGESLAAGLDLGFGI